MKANKLLLAVILTSAIGAPIVAFAEDESVPQPMAPAAGQVHYQTAKIDNVDVFYREAGPKNAHKDMTKGEMPSLRGATEWLNSPPLTAAGLRGKVVLIDFWTYSCINWIRSLSNVGNFTQ